MEIMIDWQLARNDRSYIESLSEEELMFLLDEAADNYYNGGDGLLIPDSAYDYAEEVLRKRNSNHPRLSKVRFATSSKRKVRLPFYMPSLDKVKVGEKSLEAFLNGFNGEVVISDKMDGISLLLVGTRTHWEVYTGGDGYEGGNITSLVAALPLPKPRIGVVVRAEAIMKKSVFQSFFSGKYENARNMVAGMLNPNRNDPHPLVKDLSVVAYEVIQPELFPSEQFRLLREYGFDVPSSYLFHTSEIYGHRMLYLLKARREDSPYEVDGLVITYNKAFVRPISGNPDYSKAFKANFEDDSAITVVKEIIWQPSRYGYLKPVVSVEPVRLKGVTISRVTGNNAFFVAHGYLKGEVSKPDMPIGPGAKVKIIRSGDVIPKIVEVLESAPVNFPEAGYVWVETGVDIALTAIDKDKSQSDQVEVKKLAHFFKSIGADGIDEGICRIMYMGGLKTIPEILSAPASRFLALPGFQKQKAYKVTQSIAKATQGLNLADLMNASGCFDRTIGLKRIQMVLDRYPDLLLATITAKQIEAIPGFSFITAEAFLKGESIFRSFWASISRYVTLAEPEPKNETGTKFDGWKILFSGFRNKDFERQIIEGGGEVVSGISKANLLVVKDLNSTSEKMKKAKEKGIAFVTLEAFCREWGIS